MGKVNPTVLDGLAILGFEMNVIARAKKHEKSDMVRIFCVKAF